VVLEVLQTPSRGPQQQVVDLVVMQQIHQGQTHSIMQVTIQRIISVDLVQITLVVDMVTVTVVQFMQQEGIKIIM
jgi:hypothetical protein